MMIILTIPKLMVQQPCIDNNRHYCRAKIMASLYHCSTPLLFNHMFKTRVHNNGISVMMLSFLLTATVVFSRRFGCKGTLWLHCYGYNCNAFGVLIPTVGRYRLILMGHSGQEQGVRGRTNQRLRKNIETFRDIHCIHIACI